MGNSPDKHTAVYQSDPDATPDEAFEPGRLERLVAGNRGRLLDARRTPVEVTGVDRERGMFGVLVCAFEDAGARWELPLEDVTRLQFEPGGALLGEEQREQLALLSARLDRTTQIPAEEHALARTERQLESERARVRVWLAERAQLAGVELAACVAERRTADAVLDAFQSE
ncbi:MAG TPA: hypothetical protein VMF09_06520 [Solirubrobacteraceae bacterium]|nr:hypothetical protein [Solirubrobacteraceae bacterium]